MAASRLEARSARAHDGEERFHARPGGGSHAPAPDRRHLAGSCNRPRAQPALLAPAPPHQGHLLANIDEGRPPAHSEVGQACEWCNRGNFELSTVISFRGEKCGLSTAALSFGAATATSCPWRPTSAGAERGSLPRAARHSSTARRSSGRGEHAHSGEHAAIVLHGRRQGGSMPAGWVGLTGLLRQQL